MSRRDRDWTIVAIHYRDPRPVSLEYPAGWKYRCEKYIVNQPLKSEAEAIVGRWLDEHWLRSAHLHEICYYPRNYADDARQLRAAGRVIA